jgi:ribonuclease R
MFGRRKKSKNEADSHELKQRAIAAFERYPNEPMNHKQVAKKMGVNDKATQQRLPDLLEELKAEKQLREVERGRYRLSYETGCVTGKVDMTAHGYAYIISSEAADDVFVSQKNLRESLHGDTVKVHLFARRKGSKTEGQVVEVIERARTSFVGTIGITDSFAFMIPDSRLMSYDLFIPQGKRRACQVVFRGVYCFHGQISCLFRPLLRCLACGLRDDAIRRRIEFLCVSRRSSEQDART